MAVESKAIVLTERLDALAAALRAAGVSPEQSASLLASAASATMHALTLDAILDGQPLPAALPEPAAAGPVLLHVRLAA
jgi:non-ribosomal peptide synthetase component F